MKPRGNSGKPEAKTGVVDSSSSFTISEFESGKSPPQRRASFHQLKCRSQIDSQVSEIISISTSM